MSAKAVKPPKTKLTMKDKVGAGFVFFLGIIMLALNILDFHNILFIFIGILVIMKAIMMLIPNKDGTYDDEDDEDDYDFLRKRRDWKRNPVYSSFFGNRYYSSDD